MKIVALILSAIVFAACSSASAAVPAPAISEEAPLLASEGGVLRPIDNGSRVALHDGYATVRLAPSPQSMDPRLEVAVFDSAGKQQAADVFVVTQMMDMDHGTEQIAANFQGGVYGMRLSFGMPGSWKLVVHIVRGAREETVTLVLPWVGL
jgi:YtkA-like protein